MIETIHSPIVDESCDEWYIQDTRLCVGHSMCWWKRGGHGYGCDIRNAEVFTRAAAEKLCRTHRESHNFSMWPKSYIDGRVSHHIDAQHADRAMNEVNQPAIEAGI